MTSASVVLWSNWRQEIFVMRADGTDMRQLTNDNFNDRVPRWSPDGSRIAFCSNRGGGGYGIWAIAPDSSGLRELVRPAGRALLYPLWSPDGRHVLATDAATDQERNHIFAIGDQPVSEPVETLPPHPSSLRFNFDDRIMLVDTLTKRPQEVLAIPGETLAGATLSRDNKQIYFTRGTTEGDVWLLTMK